MRILNRTTALDDPPKESFSYEQYGISAGVIGSWRARSHIKMASVTPINKSIALVVTSHQMKMLGGRKIQ